MMRQWKDPGEAKEDAGLIREWQEPGEAKVKGGLMRSWKEPGEAKQGGQVLLQWKPPGEASEGGGGIIRQWKQPSPLGHFKAGIHDRPPPQSPAPALGRGLRPQPGATITPGSRRPQPPKPMQVERPGLDPARRAAITRSKVYIRAVGFFYHLSITILFTTFTELLLVFFQNHHGKVAAFLGMCAGIERAMQFFSSPFLGNLSDSIGRKPVLQLSLVMHLVSLLIVTAAPCVDNVLVYYIINGAFNVTLTMCNAIVTDLAVRGGEGDLARQYGKLGMAVGFSLVLGPAVGPSLSKLDIRFPLYVAVTALVLCVGLCWCMTEPLDGPTRPPFIWADANPVLRLRRAFQHRRFVLFSFPFACTQVSECVYQFIILYAMKRFNWSYILLGVYVAGTGVAVAFVQGNLKYLVPKYLSEKACVVLGLMGHAVAMGIIGVSSVGWMMPLSVLFQMVSSLRNPGIMSVLSTNMPHHEQGVLQGSIQSIRVIAKAAGGPLFGLVLANAVGDEQVAKYGEWVMGMPFLVAGAFDLVGMVVAIILFDKCALDKPGLRRNGDEVGDGSEDDDDDDDETGSGEDESGTEDGDSDPEYDGRR